MASEESLETPEVSVDAEVAKVEKDIPQIQEKTISSFTEDQKLKTEVNHEEETPAPDDTVSTAGVETNGDVQASENPIVDDEKKSSEANKEEKEDTTKAENVTSTEVGPAVENDDTKTGTEEKKKEDEAQKKESDSLGSTVAKHYNEIKAGTKDSRKDSRIFHLRNFNNWVKSVLINEYLEKVKRRKRTSDVINVLDLACGKGGDLLKWQKGKVDHVIMADIAATSIEHCKERYAKLERDMRNNRHSRDRLFTIETFAADCTKELLKEKYKKPDIKLDLTSCQFAYHYSFESYEQADTMLSNACENLQVGGYFIGTTPDAQKLVKRIKGCKADSFGNSVFNIKADDNEKFPLFGSKYMFYLEGVVDCPEFIVYLPALEKLAEKYNMRLIWKKNFHELFKQFERQYGSLLHKMNAIEQYPAKANTTLSGGSESQYKSAKDYIDTKGGKHTRIGTLSADEWEVAGLYLAFAFEKVAPPREGRSDDRDSRKRHRDRSSSTKSREGHHHSHDKHHEDKRRASESSSSAKKSKKETEVDDVYEVKDEIYEEDADKMEAETATVESSTKKEEQPSAKQEEEQPSTEQLAAESEQPAAESEQPAAESEQPAAESEQPVAESEQPVESENKEDETETKQDETETADAAEEPKEEQQPEPVVEESEPVVQETPVEETGTEVSDDAVAENADEIAEEAVEETASAE